MRIRNTPKVFFTDVFSFVQSPINSHPFVEHRKTHGGTVGFVPFLYRETGCGISATNVLSILNSYPKPSLWASLFHISQDLIFLACFRGIKCIVPHTLNSLTSNSRRQGRDFKESDSCI
jgi:hypothetical protein